VLKGTKGKAEGRIFQSGDITVYLELLFRKHQDVLEHIENTINVSLVRVFFG